MPANYVLLEKVVVGAAGAASVTFNNIPQTGYTDLVVKVSNRVGSGSVAHTDYISFNGLTTNFTSRFIEGSGSAVSSQTATQSATLNNGPTSTANTFSNGEIYITNYTSSNFKSYSIDSVTENNATAAYSHLKAGLWSNTAAITSISLRSDTGNYVQHSTFSLYGVAALNTTPAIYPKATGGDIIQTDGTYWYHAFLASGSFTPTSALSCDVLVVAGGGAGGGGGGGAGGYRTTTGLSVSASATTVTIGAGGSAQSAVGNGTSGNDSVFSTITSSGGGKGNLTNAALAGGSGGGGGAGNYTSGSDLLGKAGNTPSTSPSQGNNGGNGSSSAGAAGAGGGGGAGAVGGNFQSANQGGVGGAGSNAHSSWLTTVGLGVSGYLAGGGGGSCNGSTATGGAGGGGTGADAGATAGAANTGSGGGGIYASYPSGAGGSGLVIIRYLVA